MRFSNISKPLSLVTMVTSLLFINGCSSFSPKPVSMAETEAASRSVAMLNHAPTGASPQYSVNSQRAVTRVAYRPTTTTISAQDTLDINVFKVPDLSAKALKVENNGAISLPLIGSLKVSGLSIGQAEQMITQRLSQYMQAPKVSVIRTDTAISKRVTVEGEVRTPGVFPIKGNLSFLQAIAMAQGVSELGDSRTVLFFRDGAQHQVNLDLVRTGRIPDPILRGDDRIVVLKDRAKVKEKKVLEYMPAVLAPISVFSGIL